MTWFVLGRNAVAWGDATVGGVVLGLRTCTCGEGKGLRASERIVQRGVGVGLSGQKKIENCGHAPPPLFALPGLFCWLPGWGGWGRVLRPPTNAKRSPALRCAAAVSGLLGWARTHPPQDRFQDRLRPHR